MNSKVFSSSLLSVCTALALTACGGGTSSSDSTAATAAPTSSAPTSSAQSAKYTGTWKTGCFLGVDGTTQSSTGATAYQTRSLTFVPTGASLLSVTWVDTYYASTDTTCTQASIGNVTRPSTNKVTLDATGTAGTTAVDKVTLTAAQPFPGFSAGTYNINGLTYVGAFNTSTTEKYIAAATSTTLTHGSGAPLDASGYPTTLGTTARFIFTKL